MSIEVFLLGYDRTHYWAVGLSLDRFVYTIFDGIVVRRTKSQLQVRRLLGSLLFSPVTGTPRISWRAHAVNYAL